MTKSRLRALYSRIGGEPKLKEIVHSFYRRMATDVLIGFYFDNKDIDLIADKQREFLMVAMGAKKNYTGANPASAHSNLPPILRGHFDRRLVLLRETLQEHKLAEEDIETWLEFEDAFRQVIVGK